MFKQLSQIGKNLSDEFAKGLADDLNGSQEAVADDKSGLPQEIQVKLRKFEKYEEKYPRLLAAYKNEKLRLEKMSTVERVLAENTPVSNIDDVESLTAFFKDMNEKQKMLNDEIKRLVAGSKAESSDAEATGDGEKATVRPDSTGEEMEVNQTQETSELRDKLSKAEDEVKVLRERCDALSEEKKKETSKLDEKVSELQHKLSESQQSLEESEKSHEEKVVELKKNLAESESVVKDRENSIEELKKQLETTTGVRNEGKNKKTNKKKKKKNNQRATEDVTGPTAAGEEDKDELLRKLIEEPEELSDVKRRSEDLEIKCSSLESELASLREAETDLKTKLEESENEHEKTRSELKRKELELEEVRDMLRDVGNELVDAKDQLKSQNNTDDEKLQSLIAEKDSLQEQFESEKKELKITVTNLNEKLSALRDEFSSQQEETKAVSVKLSKLSESHSKLKSDNATLLDQINEANKTKKMLKTSVLQKEKTISYLEQQVKEYSESSGISKKVNDDLKKNNDQLLKNFNSLREENEELRSEVKKSSTSFENYVRENGKLSERLSILQEKYETLESLKSNSNEQVDAIKRQCEELNSKLREANKRIISLEEEVSDYSDVIQEKTREANAMRRLLNENKHDETTKEGEFQEKLAAAIDEKGRLESELSLQASRRIREVQDWKQANNELKSEIHGLKLREKELHAEIQSLSALNANMQRKNSTFADDSNDLERVTSNLKEALSKADSKIRGLQDTNENLMQTNDDVNKKLDRLSRNYRTLMNQVNALKEEKNGTSARSSRSSSVASTGGTQTPQLEMRRSHSFVKENSAVEPQSEVNEKIAYIKNVLLGFLEHRDQRNQLLPVVSMLLQLDGKDEKRLLMSIK